MQVIGKKMVTPPIEPADLEESPVCCRPFQNSLGIPLMVNHSRAPQYVTDTRTKAFFTTRASIHRDAITLRKVRKSSWQNTCEYLGCRRFEMVYVGCGLEAKDDIVVPQPRGDNITLDKSIAAKYGPAQKEMGNESLITKHECCCETPPGGSSGARRPLYRRTQHVSSSHAAVNANGQNIIVNSDELVKFSRVRNSTAA
ncbi:hypothetical protein EVAR_13456_1 [Eumeta japonica]|uniref:Uncharacterized protein n=1 Tax=Eumeta variegata TaxID=151549 RepID=A0A4C1UZ99_EUMVA|nr:hypothetical protein EVAR_13456_1 [Eumeta japonica]